jgi:hypothetical protein
MEKEGSLRHSYEPATCPYPEPDRSSPCFHPIFRKFILILSFHQRLGLSSAFLPSRFHTKVKYVPLLSPMRATCLPFR